jgi:hypothetical protein
MALPPQITDAAVTRKVASWAPAVGLYFGYCQISDVQDLFLNLAEMPSSADDPNIVAKAITSSACELQGHLDTVYVMPYAGTDLRISARLCEINAKWAAARVFELIAAQEPAHNQMATEWTQYAHAAMMAVLTGAERWDSPFGDATSRAELPVYTTGQLARWSPQGAVFDDVGQPFFTRDKTR